MTKAVVRELLLASIALTIVFSTGIALAQSGSAGGSIGNDDTSLSGSRPDRSAEPEPALRKGKAAPDEQHSSSGRTGGGGGNFDGAWIVVRVGCGGSTRVALWG